MDNAKIDQILQYALLVAGDEDEAQSRRLRPIHLIKYVYLADLAHAEKHGGETYTGAPWRFHYFGPWSREVWARIDPALTAIGAYKQTFPSNYDDRDDWDQWSKTDDAMLRRLGNMLPLEVAVSVRNNVHHFGSATPDLLAHVYLTRPMRNAAPQERLDFSPQIQEPPVPCTLSPFTPKQKKRLNEVMNGLRAKAAARREALKKSPPIPSTQPPPRYDEVFFNGLKWLDSLAGEPLPEGELEATFSDDIWKSQARTTDELP